MASALITVSRRVFCTSTTGDTPVTVTVSCSSPTFSSIGMVSVTEPVSSMPSRLTVANPGNVTVTVYVPGRRSTIRYSPELSVTAERVFSMRTGLDGSRRVLDGTRNGRLRMGERRRQHDPREHTCNFQEVTHRHPPLVTKPGLS